MVVNELKEKYKQIYGCYPDKTFEGQRHYKEFCKLLSKNSLDDLIHQAQKPISKVEFRSDNNNQHYKVSDVTSELIVSHLMLIHELWNISIPDVGWWPKGIKAQAKGMVRDYSKEELHYYLHKLEINQWYRDHIDKPFTFNMVRKYIENEMQKEKI